MREVLTNADLAERAQPSDGPCDTPVYIFQTEEDAESAIAAILWSSRAVGVDLDGTLRRDGTALFISGVSRWRTYALSMLFFRGLSLGMEMEKRRKKGTDGVQGDA